jgi:hypothetical protein
MRVLAQLLPIPRLELIPSFVGVAIPLPEFAGRCDVRQPEIELSLFPRDASGPQPIDEYAFAIIRFGRLIDPLDLYHLGSLSLDPPTDDLAEP